MSSQEDERDPILDGDEDDDEDVAQSTRRKPTVNTDEPEDDLDDDLFGDNDDTEPKNRALDDEQLDSGDDLDRDDRRDGDVEMQDDQPQEELTVEAAELVRLPVPRPSDGELYMLKVPPYAPIAPEAFNEDTFEPPFTEDEIHNDEGKARTAYENAISTVRWRKSPLNPDKAISNARILRWSDGSLTMQFATQPKKQHTISANSLAPPQVNPPKPTPNVLKPGKKPGYNVNQDSFTYLVQPAGYLVHNFGKITAGLRIDPSEDSSDAAKLKLQQAILQAKYGRGQETNEVQLMETVEDPEAMRKKAEQMDKETSRLERKRQAQEQRQQERREGVFPAGGRRAGLTSGGLEDDDELGAGFRGGQTARAAAAKRKPRKRPSNNRGEILSDDEDDYRGSGRQDEYEQDDFVAGSDEEEEEAVESDEDPDEGISLGPPASSKRKEATPDEADAEGDPEDDPGALAGGDASPQSRKRRRIIDDDDDE